MNFELLLSPKIWSTNRSKPSKFYLRRRRRRRSIQIHHHQLPTSRTQMQSIIKYFFSVLLLLSLSHPSYCLMSSQRKIELRNLVKQTWYHGFENYMDHAFPDDELRPLSCTGLGHDHQNPNNHETNDVLGDFSMTLIDTIDTFIVLRDYENFSWAVKRIIQQIPNFDLDSKVQVFETTIRVLGGLLSGHLFAKDPQNVWNPTYPFNTTKILDYHDQLLFLAKDLADRMLPAFQASKTGIPYARINLRHGIVAGEGTETCTAGAGSLLLEFATLSRLIGDPIYERVARKAFYALWERRSPIHLFGNTIDINTGHWAYGISSIGAGIDSFYEYILKSHILLQDDSFLDLWNQAYKAVVTYMRSPDGFWYRGVNMQTGAVATTTIDSLAAFWPGLQVLAGDIEGAIQSHMTYANLWSRYSGVPEVFDIHRKQATALGYPLRPEFIESNYFLYRATKDEYYLEVAERVIIDLVNRTWVDCGLASIANLETGKLEDRMHSFMLSETLKYLYLTFDEDNPINHVDESFIFTTEGHILWIPSNLEKHFVVSYPNTELIKEGGNWEELESLDHDCPKKNMLMNSTHQDSNKSSSKLSSASSTSTSKKSPETCSIFLSPKSISKFSSPLKPTINGRTDFEYAKMITGSQGLSINNTIPSSTQLTSFDLATHWFEYGYCEVPVVDDYLIELIFSHSDSEIDRYPGSEKVEFSFDPKLSSTDSFNPESQRHHVALIKSLTSLTFSLKKSLDHDSYEIVKIGAYSLPSKTKVFLADPYAIKILRSNNEAEKLSPRDRDHLTGIRIYYEEGKEGEGNKLGAKVENSSRAVNHRSIERPVMMATFGPDVRVPGSNDLSVGNPALELVMLNRSNQHGCQPIEIKSSENSKDVGSEKKEREGLIDVKGKVVMMKRGGCTFTDKVENAVLAGAKGVIVTNEDEKLLIPTSDRIDARDEQERHNFSEKEDRSSNPLEEEASSSNSANPKDFEFLETLKSIPLLFSNFETGQRIEELIERSADEHSLKTHTPNKDIVNDLNPGFQDNNQNDQDKILRKKLMITIVKNPFELLNQQQQSSINNEEDPSNLLQPHQPKNFVVINGYKLSNLILKKN